MRNYVIIGGTSAIGNSIIENMNGNDKVYASYHEKEYEDNSNITPFYFDALNPEIDVDMFPESIDGLVYCPGTINLKPFTRFDEIDFIHDFKLQVCGATYCIRKLLPRLRKSGSGSIVLFSTIAVQNGFKFHTQVSMSKGAIEGLTKALAAEFSPKVRVNAIAPSLTQTPLAKNLLDNEEKIAKQGESNPMKRVGQAQDIATMACYLLDSKASWITGQIMHIDGGMSTIK